MLAIDHIVIASRNPEQEAQAYVEKHGIIALEGGRHEEWGTYNYLAYFQNKSYIEWIGVFDEELARKSDNPLIRQTVNFLDEEKSGIINYALRTSKLDEYIAYFEANNIEYAGPFPGSRKKVDGSMLTWRMLFPKGEKPFPFLIEWGTGVNRPADDSTINPKDIISLEVPHQVETYRHLFGLKAEANKIALENGEILFTDNYGIHFTIRDF